GLHLLRDGVLGRGRDAQPAHAAQGCVEARALAPAVRRGSRGFATKQGGDMKLTTAFAAIALALLAPLAHADWPDRPIKLIVPLSAGGANDLMGRAAAEGLSKRLKQPVVVENKPGAGAIVGTQAAAKAAPDGYTFLVSGNGVVTNSMLHKTLPYADSE